MKDDDDVENVTLRSLTAFRRTTTTMITSGEVGESLMGRMARLIPSEQ